MGVIPSNSELVAAPFHQLSCNGSVGDPILLVTECIPVGVQKHPYVGGSLSSVQQRFDESLQFRQCGRKAKASGPWCEKNFCREVRPRINWRPDGRTAGC